MNQITVSQASQEKACTGQAVRDAIRRGLIDADFIGRMNLIQTNDKYRDWCPNKDKQKGGRARAQKAKKSQK